jgi:hypothetical protein
MKNLLLLLLSLSLLAGCEQKKKPQNQTAAPPVVVDKTPPVEVVDTVTEIEEPPLEVEQPAETTTPNETAEPGEAPAPEKVTKPERISPSNPNNRLPPSAPLPPTRNNLVADGSKTFAENRLPQTFRTQVKSKTGLSYTKAHGYNWMVFRLTRDDIKRGFVRSEITRDPLDWSMRAGYTLLLPANNWPDNKDHHIITQWHATEDKGEKPIYPPIALFVSEGRFKVMINWDATKITTKATVKGKRKVFDVGKVIKDQPVHFAWFVKQSYKADGRVILAINGIQVLNYTGPNSYNDDKPQYFKIGLYSRELRNNLELWLTNFRVGGPKSSYLDVAPYLAPVQQ